MILWQPTPDPKDSSLPKFFRSVALIPDSTESNSKWRCVWDNNRSCFDFVTAERCGNESIVHAAAERGSEELVRGDSGERKVGHGAGPGGAAVLYREDGRRAEVGHPIVGSV